MLSHLGMPILLHSQQLCAGKQAGTNRPAAHLGHPHQFPFDYDAKVSCIWNYAHELYMAYWRPLRLNCIQCVCAFNVMLITESKVIDVKYGWLVIAQIDMLVLLRFCFYLRIVQHIGKLLSCGKIFPFK